MQQENQERMNNIKEILYRTIKGDITPDEFEKWLYSSEGVDTYFNPDDYLALMSFDFKSKGAKYELSNLLKKHIDLGEFETYKILGLLKEAQQKTDRLPYILMEFYDLYCYGYTFLHDIGLEIGLEVVVPEETDSADDTWEDLTAEQQKRLLDSFSPRLEAYIEQAIYWLESKKIMPTGEKDKAGHYGYKDFRTV